MKISAIKAGRLYIGMPDGLIAGRCGAGDCLQKFTWHGVIASGIVFNQILFFLVL